MGMGHLPFPPAQVAIGLGILFALSVFVCVWSLLRLRKRWREGQDALKKFHDSTRSLQLEMQGNTGVATTAAESGAKSD